MEYAFRRHEVWKMEEGTEKKHIKNEDWKYTDSNYGREIYTLEDEFDQCVPIKVCSGR